MAHHYCLLDNHCSEQMGTPFSMYLPNALIVQREYHQTIPHLVASMLWECTHPLLSPFHKYTLKDLHTSLEHHSPSSSPYSLTTSPYHLSHPFKWQTHTSCPNSWQTPYYLLENVAPPTRLGDFFFSPHPAKVPLWLLLTSSWYWVMKTNNNQDGIAKVFLIKLPAVFTFLFI